MNLSDLMHTARRWHQCACCGLTIGAGEQYVRAQLPGGGLLAKKAFHSRCYAGLAAGVGKQR